MRVTARHEVTFHDLEQPDLMVHWGTGSRRKRLRPETLLVRWDRDVGITEWQLSHVYLMGRHVRRGSSLWFGSRLFERGRWVETEMTPQWVKELVERSAPFPRTWTPTVLTECPT